MVMDRISVSMPGVRHAGDRDGQQNHREGEQDVERAHDHLIDNAAGVSGQHPEKQADGARA